MLQKNRHQHGFTLMEIAIVLVIIGLLLGAVLKGQELIVQARIKNIINDFNGIATAVYSYQERYRSYPGDDAKAARWGSGIGSGDGNGRIGGAYDSSSTTDESRLFWSHLRLAGFLTGSGNVSPIHPAGGIIGVQQGSGPSGATELAGLVICADNLQGKIAAAIDTQLDDGLSNSGQVRIYQGNPTSAAVALVAEDESSVYTACRKL